MVTDVVPVDVRVLDTDADIVEEAELDREVLADVDWLVVAVELTDDDTDELIVDVCVVDGEVTSHP